MLDDAKRLDLLNELIAILLWNFFGDPQTRGTLTPWVVLGMLVIWITSAVIYERAKAAQCQREIDALAYLDIERGRSTPQQ